MIKSPIHIAYDHSSTRWLSDTKNYNENISGLTFSDDLFNKMQKSTYISKLKLPLLLYTETRGAQNKLSTATIYWNEGSLAMTEWKSHRYLLEDSNYFKNLVKTTVRSTGLVVARGLALHLATQIEYMVHFLCCIKLNAYNSDETEKLSIMLLKSNSGSLGSFSRRINFLRANTNYIENSHEFIDMVKDIRNELAHSFFPKFVVPEEWIMSGESETRALIRIMENTWFYLLKDLSLYQNDLIETLNMRMKS